MKKFFLLLLSILVCFVQLNARGYEKVSGYEFIKLIRKGGTIKNKLIYNNNPSARKSYLADTCILNEVIFENCIFETGDFVFINTTRPFELKSCTFKDNQLNFFQCCFNSGLIINNCRFVNNNGVNCINIAFCIIDKQFSVSDSSESPMLLSIAIASINTDIKLITLKPPKLILGLSKFGKGNESNVWQILSYTYNSYRVKNEIESLIIDSCIYYCPVRLKDLVINKTFRIEKTQFHKLIDLSYLSFNNDYASIQWKQINNMRLRSLPKELLEVQSNYSYKLKSIYFDYCKVKFSEKEFSEISDEYKRLISFYRAKCEFTDANQCYIEYKKVQENYYSINNQLFNLGINKIIGWYSKYSTSLKDAVRNSFLVILFFGLIYFFWTSITNLYLFLVLKIYQLIYLIWKNNKTKAQIILIKAQKTNLLNKRSHQRKKSHENYFVFYLKELFRSIMLSINFFVTLGYSGILAEGRRKYVAVMEGLFGWFFLILLSACLINQYITIF